MYILLNELLSDISALLLHRCVQLRQPYKLVETTQIFLQCIHLVYNINQVDFQLRPPKCSKQLWPVQKSLQKLLHGRKT